MTEHEIRSHRRNPKPVRESRPKRLSRTAVLSVVAALALVVGAVLSPLAFAADGDPTATNCVGGTPDAEGNLTLNCVVPMPPPVTIEVPGPTVTVPGPTVYVTLPPSVSTTYITVTPSPTLTTVTPTVKPSPTSPPSSTPSPTPTPTPTQNPDWPNAANTGVPDSVTLQPYTGSCTITSANAAIIGRTVNCDLTVNAPNVVINQSRINGTVTIGPNGSLAMVDSEVHATPGAVRQVTGVENHDYTLTRVEITGGNRGAYCRTTCTIRDSWIHGTRITGDWHASAVRMEQHGTFIHNVFQCDAAITPQGGGCSAGLTGYGDFAPVIDNLIQGNRFAAMPAAAFCAYGGSSGDNGSKPYGAQARDIRFIGNTFERGANRKCALYGPLDGYDSSRPGNVWSANVWSDGAPL